MLISILPRNYTVAGTGGMVAQAVAKAMAQEKARKQPACAMQAGVSSY
jgi:hypothetical protein